MRRLRRRSSDWIVDHPVLWITGSGIALVVLGLVLDLSPIAVIAGAAAIATLNIVHGRRRGSCWPIGSAGAADAGAAVDHVCLTRDPTGRG
jgi:hypothetical protein